MALQIGTVVTAIAALVVDGVEIQDMDEIPTEVNSRDKPTIIPKPDGFVSGFVPERMSFGSGDVAKINVSYVLTYRMLHSKVGTGRSGLFATYADMVTKTFLFLDAIIANDALGGAVDIEAGAVPEFGPVVDPSANVFHGCDISINVLEYVN